MHRKYISADDWWKLSTKSHVLPPFRKKLSRQMYVRAVVLNVTLPLPRVQYSFWEKMELLAKLGSLSNNERLSIY